MNPKEFPWEEDQQVTVTNPTQKDFKFQVHSKEYEVKAGDTVKMPGFIAWLYVYGIASLMCQADNQFNRWNEEGFRNTYYERVIVSTEDVVQVVVPEPKVESFTSEPVPAAPEPHKPTEDPDKPEVRRGRPPKN